MREKSKLANAEVGRTKKVLELSSGGRNSVLRSGLSNNKITDSNYHLGRRANSIRSSFAGRSLFENEGGADDILVS